MPASVFTGASGWLLVILTAVTVSLPYLLRRGTVGRLFRVARARPIPWLRRLRPHYWLGYLIACGTLVHATVPMSAGLARGTNVAGLYLATGALFLVVGQVMLGRQLQDPKSPNRRATRRLHFWTMVSIVALGAGHVALNSPALASLPR